MTDYASQGKTRPYNVVNLNDNHSHQSYYTALSHSATAAGTLITQSFHPQKITGGASGALRQEFRELELLDEITDLRYNGKLHKSVVGEQRNMLIMAFIQWKGMHHVPSTIHKAIRWNSRDPLLEPEIEDVRWKIVEKQKKHAAATPAKANPTSASSKSLKRKISMITDNSTTENLKKKAKTSHNTPHMASGSTTFHISPPSGLIWSNNSYAYDAVFTIIYSLWRNNPTYWKQFFYHMNCDLLEEICNGFNNHSYNQTSLKSVRDTFRMALDDLQLALGVHV